MRVRLKYLTAILLVSGGVYGLTVEGREVRTDGGAFVPADAEWLAARARALLEQHEYGRANDIATLLAAAAPANLQLEAQALAARTKYFAVGHKESYAAFKTIYEAEKKRHDANAGAPLSEEDRARLAAVSKEVTATLGTAYHAGAVSGVRKLSSYNSPTANTGASEPQVTRYDLRWSVNLLFLIKQYDGNNVGDAKAKLKSAIDETRTFSAFFRDVSMPKSNQARALDEVRGSVIDRGRKLLPGALGREVQDTYNLEGFKFCVKKPVGATEATAFAGRVMKMGETEELKIEKYQDEGYEAFRATATVRATASFSLADFLNYYGVDPYVWRPFVGDIDGKGTKEAEGKTAPGPEPGVDTGGIPDTE